jgi:hypothetical protein
MKAILAGLTGASWAAWVSASYLPTWLLTAYADPSLICSLTLTLILSVVILNKKKEVD